MVNDHGWSQVSFGHGSWGHDFDIDIKLINAKLYEVWWHSACKYASYS